MSYTLVLEWMPGDLYMSAVTARCTAPTSSYSVVWLPPNKVYQITLYCGSTSLVSFLVGAFRGKAWSYMKLSFRWYGEEDKVTLEQIRQIPGMESIVTAVYDVPVGQVWSRESIARLKALTETAGLKFEVIESVPVHEDIKLGKPSRDQYIENYRENIRRLAEAPASRSR